MKRVLFVLLIAVLLNGCGQNENGKPVESKEDKKATQTAAKPKEEPKKELTLDEKVTQDINKKLGKDTNMKKKRIVELQVNDNLGTDEPNDKIVLLTLAGDENLSSKMTVKGMLMKSSDAFKEIFKNKEVSEATLFWKFPLVDTYGKETDENVIKIQLKKETFDKIEWKNFDYNNFEKIADQYWMHPALKKELQ
ncbi:hypothetical protein [Neobacillus massiliamazoniensis]|uniref:Uncharacterized protein n=1 Tax=Neobacillus massiliamazoniensis TaxID=1499688 RepID=A0A0U1NQI0_9BACI|nr:hypothetical protein [Neobacillus massiliamazoniensis]CRK80287.1 hypothetical protein BN000_00168 [Neobacillus massiliamazoniensis]